MTHLPPKTFEGRYTQAESGLCCDYAVTCRITVDDQGREQMHIRGSVSCGAKPLGFVVIGHVDPGSSFVGREESVAMDCVAVACEREATRMTAARGLPRQATAGAAAPPL